MDGTAHFSRAPQVFSGEDGEVVRSDPRTRPASETRPQAMPVSAPGFGGMDVGELVAGYRAGNVAWNVGQHGPPPGQPGCRVPAGILRENGY